VCVDLFNLYIFFQEDAQKIVEESSEETDPQQNKDLVTSHITLLLLIRNLSDPEKNVLTPTEVRKMIHMIFIINFCVYFSDATYHQKGHREDTHSIPFSTFLPLFHPSRDWISC